MNNCLKCKGKRVVAGLGMISVACDACAEKKDIKTSKTLKNKDSATVETKESGVKEGKNKVRKNRKWD